MDWQGVLDSMDVDIANSILVEKIGTIIDSEDPLRTIQHRTKYKNWISKETLKDMKLRDEARTLAKTSDVDADWLDFKARRNRCSKLQNQDKKSYYNKIYSDIEAEKDSAKLFSTTKKLLNWQLAGPPKFLPQGWKGHLKRKRGSISPS